MLICLDYISKSLILVPKAISHRLVVSVPACSNEIRVIPSDGPVKWALLLMPLLLPSSPCYSGFICSAKLPHGLLMVVNWLLTAVTIQGSPMLGFGRFSTMSCWVRAEVSQWSYIVACNNLEEPIVHWQLNGCGFKPLSP